MLEQKLDLGGTGLIPLEVRTHVRVKAGFEERFEVCLKSRKIAQGEAGPRGNGAIFRSR